MPVDFGSIVSLLGLLLATANLAVDVIALAITIKKGKRPDDEPPSVR